MGGAAWITDKSGFPVQYMHYAPYGELVANQRISGFDERFKFTGKERDVETGFDYFGARYYWPVGIWTSVDPLTDKYIYNSPYVYCEGNPIKYVDPDGQKSTMSIQGSTITIHATYYATQNDLSSAQHAVSFWNSQNYLTYTDQHGKEFLVKFDLTVKASDNPGIDASCDKQGNAYRIVTKLIFPSGKKNSKATGLSYMNDIQVLKEVELLWTGSHEVGHSLMEYNTPEEEHASKGIMSPSTSSPNFKKYVSQETVDAIVNSNFENLSLWEKIKYLLNIDF